jgi:hypothetical protein
VSGEEERLALAVWDTIADIMHRAIHDLPEPDRDELDRTHALRDSAHSLLLQESESRLYPFARDMALAVQDWWDDSSEENFTKLRHASRAYEDFRLKELGYR